MSLINQMLQDLDKRSASNSERGALPNQVRALPLTEKSGIPLWQLSMAAALVGIAGLAWQFGNQLTPALSQRLAQFAPPAPLPKATSTAPQMLPVRAPTPTETSLTAPASRLTLELGIVPSTEYSPPTVLAEPPAHSKLSKALDGLPHPQTVAVSLASVKQSPASLLAANSGVAGDSAINAKSSTAGPPAVSVIAARPAPSPAKSDSTGAEAKALAALANPQIQKHSQQLTPQQLAENEYREAANLLSQGRLAETQEGFKRALQFDPGHVGARQGLFGLLVEEKKNAEAEEVLRDGLKINPNQPGFALALSGLQYQRGDTAGAIETLQKTVSAAQNSPDYLARLAALLQRQSRHNEAVENYQAALRLAPGSGVWLMGLGISQQALNRKTEAQDAFRRAKATHTLNPDLQAFVDQRLKQLQ